MKLEGVSIAFLSGAASSRRDGDWRSCLDTQGWMRLVVQLLHGRRTVVDMGAGICKGRMRHTNLSRVFPTLPPLPKWSFKVSASPFLSGAASSRRDGRLAIVPRYAGVDAP
ncbi:hypothetical protein MTO96_023189 [Rhipicephalus appendiculatus]